MCVPISMEAWTRDITGKGIRVSGVFQVICRPPHGNVKVDFNLVKYRGFALPITGLKSEIRISKSETISKFKYQMTKTFREVIQYLRKFSKSPGCIRKIPLNPPLQKGEAIGMPGLIEKLPFFFPFNNPANRMEEILGNMQRLKGFMWKHVFNISKPVSGCDHDSLQVRSLR